MRDFLIKILIFSFFSCVIISCQSDCNKDLSGNYFYRDEGEDVKQIISHTSSRLNYQIFSKIICYDNNNDFIVAMQSPLKSDYTNMITFYLRDNIDRFPDNSKYQQIQSEKVADSLLKYDVYYRKIFSNKVNYWIIRISNDSIYGPLNENEYYYLRSALGVPKSLKLSGKYFFDNYIKNTFTR